VSWSPDGKTKVLNSPKKKKEKKTEAKGWRVRPNLAHQCDGPAAMLGSGPSEFRGR